MTVIGLQTRRAVTPGGAGGRSLASYLLMPRPRDLVKGWLFVATCGLGMLGVAQVNWHSLARALIVLAAVELLVYPARYQWNDARGFVADQRHPSSHGRGRLPGPMSKARSHVAASCAVAAAKLAITGLLVLLLPALHLAGLLAFAVVGVFGVAVVYEILRSTTTGRDSVVPPPVRPGIVSLWVVVGAGYVVRGMLGLGSAVDLGRHPMLAVASAVALWCYGTAFVTARWAIEATAFGTVRNGEVTWTAHADQAREHLLALVRWLPSGTNQRLNDIRDWAALNGRTPITAPWNIAIVGAGAGAALSGRLLCGDAPAQHLTVAAAVGGLAAAVVVWAAGRRPIVLVTTALLVLAALTLLQVPRPAVLVLPWFLAMSAYVFSTTRTMRKLDRDDAQPNVFARWIGRAAAAAGRVVLGASTWRAMQTQQTSSGERQTWTTSRPST
ncbi:hypothetical protein [Mycobacterium asiaticum]|uniref:hypothetical protein n=1 Tax=Mycobacterium asiaticum TaxID=1790 RepID=UPI00055D3E3D|nr:hypothetical protein [Mycobacterium asiaticum]ORA08767.1 hypothetical protein BST16_26190 [Mycobacterium asiaticum DSM 44297]